MTQPAQAMAPPQEDNLKRLLLDMEVDRRRLKKAPPADLDAVIREICDTLLVYQKDIVAELIAHRDWTNEVVEDIDDRIGEEASGGGTQLLPEDAEKFKALAMGVDHLITTLATAEGVNQAGMQALASLQTLAKECLAIIEETTIIETDEDDDEDDDASDKTDSGE